MENEMVNIVFPKYNIILITSEFLVELTIHVGEENENSFQIITRMCTFLLSLIFLDPPLYGMTTIPLIG